MRTATPVFSFIALLFLTGCPLQAPRTATSSPAQTVQGVTAKNETDLVFERKVACFDATRVFVYDAVSPRDGAYTIARGCYSPTLNTCVAEYVAPDGSATTFDLLTGETLAIYLNYPGDADQIRVSERLSGFTAESATDPEPTEEMTKERREYLRVASHLFGSCAE